MNCEKRLERYALDWNDITKGWVARLEEEMDAAYAAEDPRRYRFAALLCGEMKTAQTVMLSSVVMGREPAALSPERA